jgi:sugar transferase EpsL
MLKRGFDLLFALVGMALLWPVIAVIALVLRWKLGAPVVFAQMRPGLNGHPFRMFKFRTMTDERGADGELLPDAQRLTHLGRFLRSSSLDELPELWNVLRGDMSIVGPRPLLMEYLPLYSPRQMRRHDVRPGLTGWAQVNGRNALSWPEKFELDLWYVEHRSLWLDLRIVARTFERVLARDGIAHVGDATMPKFTGNEDAPHARASH